MYVLEMAIDIERVNKRMEFLQQAFPHLRLITKSAFFVIIGCQRREQLADDEKRLLESYVEQGLIHRFRCKRIEER